MEPYQPEPLRCPMCKACFYTEMDLRRHIASSCAYRPRGCEHCCFICRDFKTFDYEVLQAHKEQCPHPDGRSLHACICGQRIYTTITGFQRHSSVCSGVRPRSLPAPMICGRCMDFHTQNMRAMDFHRIRCTGDFPELVRGPPVDPFATYGEGEEVILPVRYEPAVTRDRIGRGLMPPQDPQPPPYR